MTREQEEPVAVIGVVVVTHGQLAIELVNSADMNRLTRLTLTRT